MARKPDRKIVAETRPAVYRPALDRVIFVVALLGVLVTVHLQIQQSRGFDRGCLGFTTSQAVEATFDCEAVVQSSAGRLFGISNATLGMLFYIVIAAITAGIAFGSGNSVYRLKQLRALLIGIGFLFTLYLVYYQYFVLDEFCALCLISAAIMTVLFGLQLADYFTHSSRKRIAMQSKKFARDGALFASLTVIVLVLAGADMLYYSGLERSTAAPAVVEAAGNPAVAPAGSAAECYYDPERKPVTNYLDLISFSDPAQGKPDAPVTVVEVFEPNCGHCKDLHPIMKQVVAKYGDQARFYFKPVMFWQDISMTQMQALAYAAQEGKFFEMIDRQFAMQQRGGLSLDQLKSVAEEIGLDQKNMAERIEEGAYQDLVLQQRKQIVEDFGITRVPAVMINGRFVGGERTVECLGRLIQEAASK